MALHLGYAGLGNPIDFDEFAASLRQSGVDLSHEDGVVRAAAMLASLYTDRTFLADRALEELKANCARQTEINRYGAQVLVLDRVAGSHFIRANFWPSRDDPVLLASGEGHYAYHLAHDHNFDFLTLGYWGPGYRSRWYEYDYAQISGYCGEAAGLSLIEEGLLSPGRMLHYRAHRDVHEQLVPDALSISINIVPESPTSLWRDQYHFDLARGCVASIATISQNEILLRIAAALSDNGLDLADDYARHHPSERVRWQAWRALIGRCATVAQRTSLLEVAASDTSSLVRGQANILLDKLADMMESRSGDI